MTSPQKLLIATTNLKKLGEFRELLKDFPVDLISLKDLNGYVEVEETGNTFEANARLKAEGYARQSGLLTLGEDSGISCDALEGAPGVYSARFAGENKSDADNNDKLLRLLKNIPDNCRGAHYTSVIALAEPGKFIGSVSGEVFGVIAHEPKGTNGFGYDPLFFYPEYQKTFGQVSDSDKHRVSHRGKALIKAKELLKSYLAESSGKKS